MFDPLKTNPRDTEQLFELSGEDILINDKPSIGIITELNFFRETEDKNLHTIEPITTGDYIKWRDRDYLVINETLSKRHHKYKTLIRHCNYTTVRKNVICRKQVGETPSGAPVYENTYGDDYIIPTVTSQRTFSIDERYAVRVVDKAVIVSVQDNELNRKSLFAINEIFKIKGETYKVINHERSVKGILSIWAEKTSDDETVPEPIDGIPKCDE